MLHNAHAMTRKGAAKICHRQTDMWWKYEMAAS